MKYWTMDWFLLLVMMKYTKISNKDEIKSNVDTNTVVREVVIVLQRCEE